MNDNGPNDSVRRSDRAASGDHATAHPMDWAVEAGAVDEIWLATKAKVRRRQRRRVTAVASGLAMLIAVAAFTWQSSDRDPAVGRVAAPSGSLPSAVVLFPDRQVLPDHSVVELKSGAGIEVEYSEHVRRVALLRGEAHFQVEKDSRRPFVVQVAGVDIRAVGTAFSVQLGDEHVEVLVTEGTIAVDRAGGIAQVAAPNSAVPPPAPLAIVDAGKRVVVELASAAMQATGPEVIVISQRELETRLSWRAPRIEFTKTPLVEVLTLINQHSRVRVVLGDPALGQVRLSGVLRADNTHTLLRLLEEEHGVTSEPRGAREVVLRKAR